MKRPELYHKTVDILVQAYFKDELIRGKCRRCAVGNLIEKAGGFDKEVPLWSYVHSVSSDGGLQNFFWAHTIHNEEIAALLMESGLKQIELTGYNYIQTAKIECAFEKAKGKTEEEKMFNGLMAVIDVLDEIHENKDSQITNDTKKKFNKQQVV